MRTVAFMVVIGAQSLGFAVPGVVRAQAPERAGVRVQRVTTSAAVAGGERFDRHEARRAALAARRGALLEWHRIRRLELEARGAGMAGDGFEAWETQVGARAVRVGAVGPSAAMLPDHAVPLDRRSAARIGGGSAVPSIDTRGLPFDRVGPVLPFVPGSGLADEVCVVFVRRGGGFGFGSFDPFFDRSFRGFDPFGRSAVLSGSCRPVSPFVRGFGLPHGFGFDDVQDPFGVPFRTRPVPHRFEHRFRRDAPGLTPPGWPDDVYGDALPDPWIR